MSTFTVLLAFLFCFMVFALAVFALSSCLGEGTRTRTDRRLPPTTYGLQYAQAMGSGARGGYSEHIEMEDMLERWKENGDED